MAVCPCPRAALNSVRKRRLSTVGSLAVPAISTERLSPEARSVGPGKITHRCDQRRSRKDQTTHRDAIPIPTGGKGCGRDPCVSIGKGLASGAALLAFRPRRALHRRQRLEII